MSSEWEKGLGLWAPQGVGSYSGLYHFYCSSALSPSHPVDSNELHNYELLGDTIQRSAGYSGESYDHLPPSQSHWGKRRLQEKSVALQGLLQSLLEISFMFIQLYSINCLRIFFVNVLLCCFMLYKWTYSKEQSGELEHHIHILFHLL